MTRILIVEDEPLIAAMVRDELEALAYDVPPAVATGAGALAAVEHERPDLVLMDVGLRGPMDGVEVASRMRDGARVPVVFMTSHADEATLARVKAVDPYGFLVKPFDQRALRTTIEVALRRHRLETELAERERWFATTLDSIGDAVIATDRDGRVTFMNPRAQSLIGWPLAEARGRRSAEVLWLFDRHGEPVSDPTQRTPASGGGGAEPANGRELVVVTRSGARVVVEDLTRPIVDGRGANLGTVIALRDVTERKRLEERLTRAERLASIGTLAAGVAHEINNPLTAVIGNLDFADALVARAEAPPDAPERGDGAVREALREAREALADAADAADRVRRIVHDLRRFARVDAEAEAALDLADVLDAAQRLSRGMLRQRGELRCRYGVTPCVRANEGRLTQVFTNLLVNAAQAIAESGRPDGEIALTTSTDAAGRAVVEVRDNGVGMSDEVVARAFDPFFTTKPVGSGMGLGLSLCHAIVTALGGEIAVESAPGHGATFRVTLPPAGPEAPATSDARAAAPTAPGPPEGARTTRVALLDDEPAVRQAIARMLRDGHDVSAFATPDELLARVAAGDTWDALLCDIMLPGTDGTVVHRRLAALAPALARRTVFISGGVLDEDIEGYLDALPNGRLAKPFSLAQLRAAIRAAAEAAGPAVAAAP
ncbi:MAG: response regulator [Myxococcota bacterium]